MSRFRQAYGRLPIAAAFIASAMVAASGAIVVGAGAGWVAMYYFEHHYVTGDELGVGIITLLAAGTFAFVILLSWLNWLHREISWRIPAVGLLTPIVAIVATGGRGALPWLYRGFDFSLVRVGWIALLSCGLVAYVISRSLFVAKRA